MRPDNGQTRGVYDPKGRLIGEVPVASRKDIRNAVEAARGAAGWSAATAHNRAQVLYFIGENLSARAGEFAATIERMTGKDGTEEVALSVDRLFAAAAWADRFDGRIANTPMRGATLATRIPCGVIGAFCADEHPLLGLVSVVAPAIAMGNRMVLVASEAFPLAATDFYQVLDTSDVPGGVVNILTGPHEALAPTMAEHMDIDAVWSFSSAPLSEVIERGSATSLKRTWVNDGMERDWTGAEGGPDAFLEAATEVKTIWIPWGA